MLRAPSSSDRGRPLKEIVAAPKILIAGQRRKVSPDRIVGPGWRYQMIMYEVLFLQCGEGGRY